MRNKHRLSIAIAAAGAAVTLPALCAAQTIIKEKMTVNARRPTPTIAAGAAKPAGNAGSARSSGDLNPQPLPPVTDRQRSILNDAVRPGADGAFARSPGELNPQPLPPVAKLKTLNSAGLKAQVAGAQGH